MEIVAEKRVESRKTFYPIRDNSDVIGGISINAFFEFWGDDAVLANRQGIAEEFHFEPENQARLSAGGKELGAVYRAYLPYKGMDFFPDHQKTFRVIPACAKIQLLRWDGFHAVCVRKSEIEKLLAEGKSPFWGFGRPHPFLPEFRVSQWFAGPIAVPLPGESNDFEPFFLKVYQNRSGEERILGLSFYWAGRDGGLRVVVLAGEEAPAVLRDYQFSGSRAADAVDPEHEKRNSEALEDLFLRTRRPITDGRPGSNKMDKAR